MTLLENSRPKVLRRSLELSVITNSDAFLSFKRGTFLSSVESAVSGQWTEVRLLLFVCGDDAAPAMRTFPIALLEVSARISDLLATVLARHRDVLLFRHAARITESCLECILAIAGGELRAERLPRLSSWILEPRISKSQTSVVRRPLSVVKEPASRSVGIFSHYISVVS